MISRQTSKYHPVYFNEMGRHPNTNPILIGIDWRSVNFIRNHKGICLLCDRSPHYYDLSFCYQRETWVLYSCQQHFLTAMQLARNIQLSGASKVFILLIASKWLGGHTC